MDYLALVGPSRTNVLVNEVSTVAIFTDRAFTKVIDLSGGDGDIRAFSRKIGFNVIS